MGPELIGDELSPSNGGGWSELHLECVHRQITFVVHDYTCSLAFKPNEPKTLLCSAELSSKNSI